MNVQLVAPVLANFTSVRVFRGTAGPVTAMDYSHESDLLMTCSEGGDICIYDIEKGVLVTTIASKKYGVDFIRFMHDKNFAIHSSTKSDEQIR